jgi:hypothetical protein
LCQCECGCYCNPVYNAERGSLTCDKAFLFAKRSQTCTHEEQCMVFQHFKCSEGYRAWSVFTLAKGLTDYSY